MENNTNTKEFYDEFSSRVLLQDFTTRNLRHVEIKNLCKQYVNKKTKVLEVGCGVGIITKYLSKKASKVISLDISPVNIEVAKKFNNSRNVEFHILDICTDGNILKKYAPFDIIIMPDVIEHISKDKYSYIFNLFTEILIEDDGKVLLTYPSASYQNFLKEHQPSSLQLIDETIEIEELLSSTSLRPLYYKLIDVWLVDQYVHLVLGFEKKFSNMHPSTTYANKIYRKFLSYSWFLSNFLFKKKINATQGKR